VLALRIEVMKTSIKNHTLRVANSGKPLRLDHEATGISAVLSLSMDQISCISLPNTMRMAFGQDRKETIT